MSLVGRSALARPSSADARREIVLWTTRDGREIPLDEMSDEHIANAIRVLSLWRTRLKRRGGDEAVIGDLKDAVTRFKALERRRRKAAGKSSSKPLSRQSASAWPRASLSRSRKPVAST